MSYDHFCNSTQHLAGPTSAVTRLSRHPTHPSSTSAGSGPPSFPPGHSVPHYLTKNQDMYLIRPYACVPLAPPDDDATAEMAKYFDPRYLASKEHARHDGVDFLGLNDTVRSDSRLTLSSFHHEPESSLQPSPMLSPLNTGETCEPHLVVTSELEDPEDSDTGNLCFSRTLCPYAPMPLPPIFSIESDSKQTHVPVNGGSYASIPASWLEHDDKPIPLDPALGLSIPRNEPAPADTQFARGSTTSKVLWTSAHLAQIPPPIYRALCPEPLVISTGIPLKNAEKGAEELRARNPDLYLPVDFLMTFMGQPEGQLLWHCYIQGCGKQLTRKGHMCDHIRMHLNDKMFECEHCPQTFLRKADCKRHAATHDPVKAFSCNTCTKSYGRKDLLTRHARVCQLDKDDEDEDRDSCKTKRKSRKRKGIQDSSLPNTQHRQDTPGFINPSMLLMQSKSFTNGGSSWTYGSDDDEKENIDPSLLPSGPVFSADTRGTDVEWRKKARTRF